MAWSSGELILGNEGTIGSRTSNVFVPQNPGNGDEWRVQAIFTNPSKLANPDTHLEMAIEVKAADGTWKQHSSQPFNGAPGTTESPSIGIVPSNYGKEHRAILGSETDSNVGLWLQQGQYD